MVLKSRSPAERKKQSDREKALKMIGDRTVTKAHENTKLRVFQAMRWYAQFRAGRIQLEESEGQPASDARTSVDAAHQRVVAELRGQLQVRRVEALSRSGCSPRRVVTAHCR